MLKQHPSLREHTEFEWRQAMAIIDATGENQPFVAYFNGWFWWSTPTL